MILHSRNNNREGKVKLENMVNGSTKNAAKIQLLSVCFAVAHAQIQTFLTTSGFSQELKIFHTLFKAHFFRT